MSIRIRNITQKEKTKSSIDFDQIKRVTCEILAEEVEDKEEGVTFSFLSGGSFNVEPSACVVRGPTV